MEDSGDESVSFNVADYVRLESEGNIRKIYVVHDIVGGGRQAHHKLPLRTCLRSHLPHTNRHRRRRRWRRWRRCTAANLTSPRR